MSDLTILDVAACALLVAALVAGLAASDRWRDRQRAARVQALIAAGLEPDHAEQVAS